MEPLPGKAKHDTARPINNMTRHTQHTGDWSRATAQKNACTHIWKKPNLISGMANLVVSVIMIWLECCANPAPPPITNPSQTTMTGLPKSAIARLAKYSPRKNFSAAWLSPARIEFRTCRISPPAQKAESCCLRAPHDQRPDRVSSF